MLMAPGIRTGRRRECRGAEAQRSNYADRVEYTVHFSHTIQYGPLCGGIWGYIPPHREGHIGRAPHRGATSGCHMANMGPVMGSIKFRPYMIVHFAAASSCSRTASETTLYTEAMLLVLVAACGAGVFADAPRCVGQSCSNTAAKQN